MRKKEATDLIAEYFKLIPPTAGIMIGLIGALTASTSAPSHAVKDLRYSTIPLVVAIVVALFGLQFMISAYEKEADNATEWPSDKCTVQVTFFLAWGFFLLGCGVVIYSLFQF